MDSVDLTIGLPIWYGAKVEEVEECMDSIYSALEKIDPRRIHLVVGIDNVPQNFKPTIVKKNNVPEIENRIKIFKDALQNLSKKYTLEYFITEKNMRVSVMRNIMISKAQNSKYILFVDHDDKMKPDAFRDIFEVLDDAHKKKIVAVYFQTTVSNEVNKYEGLAPWGALYSPKFLLKNKIAFIPGIPLEDRYFRREVELYALEEEQLNIPKSIYIHVREQASGWLPDNYMTDIVRQELYKRCLHTGIKPKSYLTIKRGLDEVFYQDIALNPEKYNLDGDKMQEFFDLANRDEHVSGENFKFYDGKDLFNYPAENQFTLCKIKNELGNIEIFCRGCVSNGVLEIDFEKTNFSAEKEKLNSHKLFDMGEKNIFDQTFEAILKEDIDTVRKNIVEHPEILSMVDDRGINLANIACRRQTIQDYFQVNVKSFFVEHKNKIIALLLRHSPSSFMVSDKYGQSGFNILLVNHLNHLKIKNKIEKDSLEKFIKKILPLLELLGEKDYELIPILKTIYMGRSDPEIEKFITDKNADAFIDSAYQTYIGYLNKELLKDNLVEALENKDYNRIGEILLTKKIPLTQFLGAQEMPGNDVEIIFYKYTKFTTLMENLEDNILPLLAEDEKLKTIFRKLFVETIFLSIYNKSNSEILNPIILERVRKAFEFLFDKKYDFNYREFNFKLFAEAICERSKILNAAKSFVELAKKLETSKKVLDKKEIAKLDQINEKFSKGIGEGSDLILKIEELKDDARPDSEKIFILLDILETFAKSKAQKSEKI